MVIAVDLNPSKLPELLKLYHSGGRTTRLRLSRHILEHEEVPLDTLLLIYHYVDRDTWSEYKLYNLKKRLLLHVDDPVLYFEFKEQIDISNESQKNILFDTLCSIGRRDILPDVIPYLVSSTPWIGFPALALVSSLATPEDLPLLRKINMQANSNEHMRCAVMELIGKLNIDCNLELRE